DFGSGAGGNRWRNGVFGGDLYSRLIRLGFAGEYSHAGSIANDVALRGEYDINGFGGAGTGQGMVGVVKGDGSGFGDIRFARLASGSASGGDPTFATNAGYWWNLFN